MIWRVTNHVNTLYKVTPDCSVGKLWAKKEKRYYKNLFSNMLPKHAFKVKDYNCIYLYNQKIITKYISFEIKFY